MSKALALFLLFLFSALVLDACTKTQARTANDAVVATCELLAIDVADQTGNKVEDVIAKTCAIERFTRKLRDALLAQQMRELYRQKALTPAEDTYEGIGEAAAEAAEPAAAEPAEPAE
jgi:hypothetical protein